MRPALWTLAFAGMATTLFGSCSIAAQTKSSKGVSDKPLSAYSEITRTPAENKELLESWTGWDGTADGPLSPLDTWTEFPNEICQEAGICAPVKNCPSADSKCAATQRVLYIIHIVEWEGKPNHRIALNKGTWFLAKFDATKRKYTLIPAKDDAFPDLYDFDNGALVSVSRLAVNNDLKARVPSLTPPDIDYTVTATQKLPSWLSGLEGLISGLAGPAISTSADYLLRRGIPSELPKYFYTTKVKARLLQADELRRPFDVSISGKATSEKDGDGSCNNLAKKSNCTLTNSLSVAQREFVTFGVGIVPRGPKQDTFSTSNGTVTAGTTRHDGFYGIVDFTPLPRRFPMNKYPYIQGGLPFSGSAFHLPYAGAAYPLPFFRKQLPLSWFAGAVFMKQSFPGGKTNRATKLLWGFEVPLTSFTGAIKQVTGDKK